MLFENCVSTYQYTRRFSPSVKLRVTAYNSSCRLCLAMRQLQVAVELHQHARMSMHCVTDVSHLHHMLESRHHLPAAIQPPRDVRTLNFNCIFRKRQRARERKREKKHIRSISMSFRMSSFYLKTSN